VRKGLLMLVLVAVTALASVSAAGAATPPPAVNCGPTCTGGGGFTGCSTISASRSASVSVLAGIRHYVVVSYCKRSGVITSLSIAAHGCDTSGLMLCSTGPAWVSGGGVGSGWATVEAHATWRTVPTAYLSSTDVLVLTIPAG
jgi:hypothetical protein